MSPFERIQRDYDSLPPDLQAGVKWLIRFCPRNCDLAEGTLCHPSPGDILHWHPGHDYVNIYTREEAAETIRKTVEHHNAKGDPITAADFKIYPSTMTVTNALIELRTREALDRMNGRAQAKPAGDAA